MGRKRLPPRVRANRLNAKKSTGPKSPTGKKRSARNAILHGLSSDIPEFTSYPGINDFIDLLCEGDERPQVIQAAREVADAQFQLNAIREYKLALHMLKARGRNIPLPESDLLADPVVRDFVNYIAAGQPLDFGVPKKADFRLHRRIINFIFRQAHRKSDPDLERFKLDRYERMAMRRRLVAIEKLDEVRTELLTDTPLPKLPRMPRPRALLTGIVVGSDNPCHPKAM